MRQITICVTPHEQQLLEVAAVASNRSIEDCIKESALADAYAAIADVSPKWRRIGGSHYAWKLEGTTITVNMSGVGYRIYRNGRYPPLTEDIFMDVRKAKNAAIAFWQEEREALLA